MSLISDSNIPNRVLPYASRVLELAAYLPLHPPQSQFAVWETPALRGTRFLEGTPYPDRSIGNGGSSQSALTR